jgi:hypothetical protein
MLAVTSRVQTSRISGSLEKFIGILLESEEHDLQRFMKRTSLKPIVEIYDAVTMLDAISWAMRLASHG